MQTILLLVIILGILVFVHELGHFLVAIRNGVKAEEFGFGFPPRILGIVKEKGKKRIIWGNKNVKSDATIFSLNWIPLGGFVKIKGENGENKEKKEKDSFASQSAWVRIKILAAGVMMNFFLAWILMSVVFMLGAPEIIENKNNNQHQKVQITQVLPNTPAAQAELQVGDEIISLKYNQNYLKINSVQEVQNFVQKHKGEEIIIKLKRGNKIIKKNITPRKNPPQNQGALGIGLANTTLVKYPWYQAIYKGLVATFNAALLIFTFLGILLKKLFGGVSVADQVAGPVGIAYMTKQVSELGLIYLLQFMAILSINLGVINILPFPALDGGRILFILIEKIKGKPLSQKIENLMHNLGFILLISVMIVVTFNDFLRYHLIDKIKHLF